MFRNRLWWLQCVSQASSLPTWPTWPLLCYSPIQSSKKTLLINQSKPAPVYHLYSLLFYRIAHWEIFDMCNTLHDILRCFDWLDFSHTGYVPVLYSYSQNESRCLVWEYHTSAGNLQSTHRSKPIDQSIEQNENEKILNYICVLNKHILVATAFFFRIYNYSLQI